MTAALEGESAYVAGTTSFLAGLRPQDALTVPLERMLEMLRRAFGEAVDIALSPAAVDLATPLHELPEPVRSPRAGEADGSWMRRTNMVGVNVRTVGDYGGVIKYAMTLPAAFDSIHLLPIWEPGVVESLYGIAGWNLNVGFFSPELAAIAPHLDTVERQLRAVSNLIHVMGKTIGMDVIPHTDRFSEAAVGTPDLFEWMRVVDREIVDHSDGLIDEVEQSIHDWLLATGSADDAPVPGRDEILALPERARLAMLFGEPRDLEGRTNRRVDLIRHLKREGLEPVPATMGIPFRKIAVDPDPSTTVVDAYGSEWHDYVIIDPGPMSRVFTPLARYKLYERLDDNRNWEIDFDRPRSHVWEYVSNHYAGTQHIGNFDFMRGDMSHVQMRPNGPLGKVDDRYDILRAVKVHIRERAEAPWFGYFAESFLYGRDVFGHGEEMDHLEASLADAALGDLQSTVVGNDEYLARFRRYLDDLATRRTAPSFTIFTADKDDPRFDEFYRAGNEARLFTALFVPDMPSYTGLGFEIRDVHHEPVENERYTKLFVFRERGESNIHPSKARFGDEYVWGVNEELFGRLTRLRVYAEGLLREIADTDTWWLVPPDATGERRIAAWTQKSEQHIVFVVNYDLERRSGSFGLPALRHHLVLTGDFSTTGSTSKAQVVHNGLFHPIDDLAPGEGRAYRVRGEKQA